MLPQRQAVVFRRLVNNVWSICHLHRLTWQPDTCYVKRHDEWRIWPSWLFAETSPELCSIQRRKRVHIFILVNMWTDVQIKNRPAFCFRIWRVEEKSRRHDTRFCFVHFKVDCFTFQWLLRTIYCQLSLCSLDKFGLFFKELDLCDLRRNSLSGWFYIVWNNRHFPLRHQQKHTNCSAEIDSCSCFAAVTETRSHSLNVITLFSCRTSSHLKRFLFVLSCFVFQTWTFPPAAVSLTADEENEDDKHRVKDTRRDLMDHLQLRLV